jgi:hypothetical protein
VTFFSSRVFDPAVQGITRLGGSVAGSLIFEVNRRTGREPRRTPGNLLLEDPFGRPGPALVDPVTDLDTLAIPPYISADQVKALALAAGKVVLDGGVDRILGMAQANLRNIPRAISAGWWRRPRRDERDQTSTAPELHAERAWNRFLAAFDALDKRQTAFVLSPSDLTAEQMRWAEVELEDAVAVAGEFQVHNLQWSLTCESESD